MFADGPRSFPELADGQLLFIFPQISLRSTVNLLSLDGDGSFRANRGSETIKTVGE